MDRWKGPHSQIIAATPGLEEYRQVHLAERPAADLVTQVLDGPEADHFEMLADEATRWARAGLAGPVGMLYPELGSGRG